MYHVRAKPVLPINVLENWSYNKNKTVWFLQILKTNKYTELQKVYSLIKQFDNSL